MCVIALILTVFFLDNMKEEMAIKFSLVKLLMDIKKTLYSVERFCPG